MMETVFANSYFCENWLWWIQSWKQQHLFEIDFFLNAFTVTFFCILVKYYLNKIFYVPQTFER